MHNKIIIRCFHSTGAVAVINSMFGKPSNLSNVECTGTENTLFDCSAVAIPGEVSISVANFDVAGVICRDPPPVTPATNCTDTTAVVFESGGTNIELYVIIAILCVVIIVLGIIVIM